MNKEVKEYLSKRNSAAAKKRWAKVSAEMRSKIMKAVRRGGKVIPSSPK